MVLQSGHIYVTKTMVLQSAHIYITDTMAACFGYILAILEPLSDPQQHKQAAIGFLTNRQAKCYIDSKAEQGEGLI
jgi:hypothetical protein